MSDKNEDDKKATGPTVAFAREAAVVALGKLLDTKKRGDRVTAAEIQEATGFPNWRSFRQRIFSWTKSMKLVPFAVANDGWRFGLAHEHVDFAEKNRKKALRTERRGLKALLDTPGAELDDKQMRRAEFATRLAARRCAQAEADEQDTRREFKLTGRERVPLLTATPKDAQPKGQTKP